MERVRGFEKGAELSPCFYGLFFPFRSELYTMIGDGLMDGFVCVSLRLGVSDKNDELKEYGQQKIGMSLLLNSLEVFPYLRSNRIWGGAR